MSPYVELLSSSERRGVPRRGREGESDVVLFHNADPRMSRPIHRDRFSLCGVVFLAAQGPESGLWSCNRSDPLQTVGGIHAEKGPKKLRQRSAQRTPPKGQKRCATCASKGRGAMHHFIRRSPTSILPPQAAAIALRPLGAKSKKTLESQGRRTKSVSRQLHPGSIRRSRQSVVAMVLSAESY